MSNDRALHVPADVRALAVRLGACMDQGGSSVALTQHGVMRDSPAGRWKRFTARQRIDLQRIDFEWRASTGPFGCISVVDALTQAGPTLDVKLFRYIKLAHLAGTAAVAKGEMMRYLAELAWAPDSILTNRTLEWRFSMGKRSASARQ